MTKPGPPHLIRRRYRLAEWLGRGSIGVVYRAQDEALDRPVVIKFLDPGESTSPEAGASGERGETSSRRARFLREARTVARLSHPNIMAIYDVGQDQGWEYLVLEYISGGDLRKLLKQRGGQVPPAEAVSIADSILQALAYAHEQGIVHRDIKPENILITQAGQVKVADFSLARGKDDLRLTQDGAITGTVAYLAPESLRGVGSGPLADLYSLGAVLYELLTGRLPFDGENLATLLSKIIYGAFEPPRTFTPEISPELEQFLLRLLATNPDMRFPTAGEALSELEHIKETLSGGAQLDSAATDHPGKAFLLVGASRDLAGTVETERRQVAGEIRASIIEPLNLLLAQATTFEQTLPGQPSTRMAISVLTSLARQVLQRAHDLEDSLHPALLETLGLEPAFEALADQYERAYNLRLTHTLAHLPQRPPPAVELELFRLTQEALETLRSQRIAQAALELRQEGDFLRLELSFAATAFLSEQALAAMRERLNPLGGELVTGRTSQGQTHLSMRIPLRREIHFTAREQQILEGLVQGLSNKQIAAQLSVSPRTVNYHLDNIFSKLGVRTRTEAAVIALRQGWARHPAQGSDPAGNPG